MEAALNSSSKDSALDAGACRVIVVDDSAVVRGLIARALESEKGFKVVATAGNGQTAVQTLQRHPADVVLLDIEMPVMDGLTALPQLKAVDPAVQVIVASTLTQKNAEISIKALESGATDYVPKPSSDRDMSGAQAFNRELIEKVRNLTLVARRKGVRRMVGTQVASPKLTPAEKKQISLRSPPTVRPDIIAIGSSTGGPQALFQVIKVMGGDLPQPVVITQHMPPSFTSILAEHIKRQCGVNCIEGRDGEILKPKNYYLAPGDFHMLLVRKPEGVMIKLTKDPHEHYCRPAVDPMLRSLVEAYGRKILTIILTGMGADGCKGSGSVVNAGGSVIAQDEASSVVWGMPGAVATAGLCSSILPVDDIGSAVKQIATRAGV